MTSTYGHHLKDALVEARMIFTEQVEIPQKYLEALYLTQLFEILLEMLYSSLVMKGKEYFTSIGLDYNSENRDKWTINDYLRRIKTFFPEEKYGSAYQKLQYAMEKRNNFIHKCFKLKNGEIQGISLDKKKFHLDKRAIRKVEEWIEAYNLAYPSVLSLMSKVNKARKH